MKLIPALISNAAILICTVYCIGLYFFDEERKPAPGRGIRSFRYFTTLSNVFSALVSAVWILPEIRMLSGAGQAPAGGLLVLKFMGAVSVTVTLLTVLFFLGPNMGYGPLFAGSGLYLHLIGPVLALLAFCGFEKGTDLRFPQIFCALLPTALYGAVYLNQVVRLGEDRGGWEDFYGFNRNGKWKVSIVMMLAASLAIGTAVAFAHNL